MQTELFRNTGIMALGSRLRIFADSVTNDASRIYSLYGLDVQAKWFPVLFTLSEGKALSIVEMARRIGHSHPSVVKICREMESAGLVHQRPSARDRRSTEVSLTTKGRKLVPTLRRLCDDTETALCQIDTACSERLWKAIGEWEDKLCERSLFDRTMEVKVERERDEVQIVTFDDALHHDAFKRLNEQWISEMFGLVEDIDHEQLERPLENIIARGGQIYIALLNGEPVGTIGMIPCAEPYDWEIIKFAVSPAAQGHGIGRRLIDTCLRRARATAGYRLFIETNRKCAAAVHLYERAGFRHLPLAHSDFARCDVQMSLTLE